MTMKQLQAIEAHGRNLLAIFPDAKERDPVALCKKLRRLETQAAAIALRLCNGPEYPGGYEEVDKLTDAILGKVNVLLGNVRVPRAKHCGIVPVFLNRDPRGYALKIRDDWMQASGKRLHRDWGGYGILAPEIGKDGN